MVEVLGFNKSVSDKAKPRIPSERRTPTMVTVAEEIHNRELGSVAEGEAETIEVLAQISMDAVSSGIPQSDGDMARPEETTTQRKVPNFVDCVRDINDDAKAASVFTLSSAADSGILVDNIGKISFSMTTLLCLWI